MCKFLEEEEKVDEALWYSHVEELPPCESFSLPSNLETPKLELKQLPQELKYAFLGEKESFPIVISSQLDSDQEGSLMELLKQHRTTLGWTIADLKGISPTIRTHKIYLEDDTKPSRQM